MLAFSMWTRAAGRPLGLIDHSSGRSCVVSCVELCRVVNLLLLPVGANQELHALDAFFRQKRLGVKSEVPRIVTMLPPAGRVTGDTWTSWCVLSPPDIELCSGSRWL